MVQKSILRNKIYLYIRTVRQQSSAVQFTEEKYNFLQENIIDAVVNMDDDIDDDNWVDEDCWIENESPKVNIENKMTGEEIFGEILRKTDFIAPSLVAQREKVIEDFTKWDSKYDLVESTVEKVERQQVFSFENHNVKLNHLVGIRNKYKLFDDEQIEESIDLIQKKIDFIPSFVSIKIMNRIHSKPSKHESLQQLGKFLSYLRREEFLDYVPAVRIHQTAKYYNRDFSRLIDEWSQFYEEVCGSSHVKLAPELRYALLCYIFELLTLNLTIRNDETYRILAKFFIKYIPSNDTSKETLGNTRDSNQEDSKM